VESSEPIRSRAEIVLLWAQLVLVLGDALAVAQGWTAADGARGWATLAPLLCVLPSTAAFREMRAAAIGVVIGALLSAGVLAWSGGETGSVLGATWPQFAGAVLLLIALRVRRDREREASRLHGHTRANREELEASEACGCIACERIYFPSEIVGWAEEVTALCPHCGADAVVGSASGIPIIPGVLRRAHERWFLVG
jgi:hypothetical protein